jgi:hypothetical protein
VVRAGPADAHSHRLAHLDVRRAQRQRVLAKRRPEHAGHD